MVLPYVTLSLMLDNIQFFALNTSNYEHKDNGNILGNGEKIFFCFIEEWMFFESRFITYIFQSKYYKRIFEISQKIED